MYVCMHVRVCARAQVRFACELRVWLGVGVCVRVACFSPSAGCEVYLVCARTWSVCLCGVCVCTFVGCMFLPDDSVTLWVRSGYGCVRCMFLPGFVVVL